MELNFITTGGDGPISVAIPPNTDIVLHIKDGALKLDCFFVQSIAKYRRWVQIVLLGFDGYITINKPDWEHLKKRFPLCPRCQHPPTFMNPLGSSGTHKYLCEDTYPRRDIYIQEFHPHELDPVY